MNIIFYTPMPGCMNLLRSFLEFANPSQLLKGPFLDEEGGEIWPHEVRGNLGEEKLVGDTVDGRNPANQLIGSLSHSLQGFVNCR